MIFPEMIPTVTMNQPTLNIRPMPRVVSGSSSAKAENTSRHQEAEERLTAQHAVTRVLAESATLSEAAARLLQALLEEGRADGAVEPIDALEAESGIPFLGGAQAQEESLARSSGLYASLLAAPAFYDRHRCEPSPRLR